MNIMHNVALPLACNSLDSVVDSALKIDARHYVLSAEKQAADLFVKNNRFGYEVAITSWLVLIDENNPHVADKVREQIAQFGLARVIDIANQNADALIQDKELTFPWYALKQGMRSKLQVLRYLKRFTPLDADSLTQAAQEKFLECQSFLECFWTSDKLLALSRSYLFREIRMSFSELFTRFREIPDFTRFSPGSQVGVGRSLVEKANQLVQSDPDAICRGANRSILGFDGEVTHLKLPKKITKPSHIYRTIADEDRIINDARYGALLRLMPNGWDKAWLPAQDDDNNIWAGRDLNTVLGVPKNYKTSRLIAPETTLRQWNASRVAKALEAHFTPLARQVIPLHNQEQNQDMARLGSTGKRLIATIDQSSASDLISEPLFRALAPDWFVDLHDRYSVRANRSVLVGEYYRYVKRVGPDGPSSVEWRVPKKASRLATVVKTQTHLTSGNALTFIEESLIFAAIAIFAVRYSFRHLTPDEQMNALCDLGALTGSTCECVEDVVNCSVSIYGDDVCLPSFAAPFFMDTLVWLGLKPNMQKSFYLDTPFRESCGADYLDGELVSSNYWPRREIKDDDFSVMPMIALQHRFEEHRILGPYLANICRTMAPGLTSHGIGDAAMDIHEEIPTVHFVPAPMFLNKGRDANPAFLQRLKEAAKTASLYNNIDAAGLVDVPMTKEDVKEKRPAPEGLRWAYLLREVVTTYEPQLPAVSGKVLHGAEGQYVLRIFLEEGPWFKSPLDELLGVSTPRWDANELFALSQHFDARYVPKRSTR